ncbi:kinase-like protein [Trematosphaeria pertusa]|uniref:non-specific serine/threonine protein kinase n=1 Tax=Trematosphaeria pertusa TaxID=390896 RepID=A0A6A6IB14_9PLEO|nr:kinase-like protein [Trematosphaeria pertusa]KAF2247429.1 kinase-like protein [Trematosphaeria pertusa]
MKIRSFVEQKGTLNVRMYSDYAPSGDLELIFDYYAPRDATDKTETSETPKQIPEPFIWLVFYALAEALFALNTGVCAKTGGADTGTSLDDIRKKKKGPWTSHQHADIKPKNIFLASPEDPYGAYPKPLLGDFDVAQPIRSQSASARRQERGTPGWKAPETENKDLHPVYDITSKTDIWAVGLVIWELMHASLGTERLELLRSTAATNFAFHANDTFPSERILGWNAMYTQTLHDLVTRCLKINPNQRPSFIELRKEVWEGMQRLKGVLGDFEGVDVVERLRLRFERGDEFAVGGVAELPERKKRKGGGGEELAPMPGDT